MEGSCGHLGPKKPQEAPREKKKSENNKISVGRGLRGGRGVILAPRGTKTPPKGAPAKLEKMVLVGFGAILGPRIDEHLVKW